MKPRDIAEAISRHAYDKAYDYFSNDIVWNIVGGKMVTGKEDVIKECKESAEYLASVKTTFRSFVTRILDNAVVIESTADYIDGKDEKSSVASCDIYTLDRGMLSNITSYNIELP